jgi:syntaxin-binding protein 1
LGEYPKIRYYRPAQPMHEASVLCSHLARFVQEELDAYAKYNPNFPPPTTRPPGMLIITDRSMDLVAPIVHEFTYQAMAHDLLPIKESDKVYYKTIINEGAAEEKEKEMEIGEKDEIWVKNRHMHMKDTIERLMGDFQKFLDENPHFTSKSGDATSLNAIKDMLAGLPQFQELKEAYSLHLSMAQECMNIFQHRKLPDVASVEQSLATRLDEDYKKPKNLADQVVRLLDDDSISKSDRLRLIMLYIIYRDGVILQDIQRLLAHAGLPPQDGELVTNLDLLGGRSMKALKDNRPPPPPPLFLRKTAPTAANEEYALSRFEPALKLLLEELNKGILDPITFPWTKPPLDNNDAAMYTSQASLRSAKPTWAQNRRSMHESKQRVIVFMAGGATYSESRSCYEISRISGKDIFLATSHMLTPAMFLRQVGDLSVDKRRLDLPSERPKPRAPAHIFEREEKRSPASLPPVPAPGGARPPPMATAAPPRVSPYQPPTAGMANMTINSGSGGRPSNGSAVSSSQEYRTGRLEKKKDGEEKKKRGFFSSGKK